MEEQRRVPPYMPRLTAKEVLARVLEHPNVKKNLRVPHKALGETSTNVSREDSLRAFYRATAAQEFARRHKIRSSDIRAINRLVAIQAAPGGGKSHFIDQVASLSARDLDAYCVYDGPAQCMYGLSEDDWKAALAQTRRTLQNALPIIVSFSDRTAFNKIKDKTQDWAFSCRLLYSAFIDPDEVEYRNWVAYCADWPLPDAIDLLSEVCSYAQNTLHMSAVLLCVDDLMKLDGLGPDAAQNFLTTLCGAMDTLSNNLYLLVSTLVPSPISQLTTRSGRVADWIPLPPFSSRQSLELFMALLSSATSSRQEKKAREEDDQEEEEEERVTKTEKKATQNKRKRVHKAKDKKKLTKTDTAHDKTPTDHKKKKKKRAHV